MSNKKISVLVIDDEPMILMNMTSLLEDHDIDTKTVESGFEALKEMENIDCDIAIVDMRMQHMDGEETIKNLHKKKPDMKFILHTGSVDYQLSDELKQIGVSDRNILFKPVIDNEIYITKIREILN